jgi:ketosteroid isomerase-like protein
MRTRYAAMAVNGPNDPSKALKCADQHPPSWGTFADAKAAVVVRAEMLREHLAATESRYRMHSSSGDHRYEISFEYGTKSDHEGRPFKVTFRVRAFVKDQELFGDLGH